MPSYLPIPEGLELPDEKDGPFVLPVTFAMSEGQLVALEIDGSPLPDPEAEMEDEMEGEMDEADFLSAVEAAVR
jgi:hypothetical protein